MAKRPCFSSSPRVSQPDSTSRLLESLLSLSEESLLSLDVSFDALVDSTPSDLDQADLIGRVSRLGSFLTAAANRCERKRSERHNSVAWPLPYDITIKIFATMDTRSIIYAAVTCLFFRKCAEDPLCYSNIDLITENPKINNLVVSTMVNRAGKGLRSLKLGIVAGKCSSTEGLNTAMSSRDVSGSSWTDKRSRLGNETSMLTRSCLTSLSENGGAPGAFLRRMHLYNIGRMDNAALSKALSACPSLHDLEVVGLHVELSSMLESVSINCHLIERLHFKSSGNGSDDSLQMATCRDLVKNCPHVTSLALKGFKLHDCKVRILVKGFRKLKYADFSTSYSINGTFLRNLGTGAGGSLLEVLLLRDCLHLREVILTSPPPLPPPLSPYLSFFDSLILCYDYVQTEVSRILTAVIGGDFKLLRHLDISNREGLASDPENNLYYRCCSTSFIPVDQLLEKRPEFCLLAEFPQDGSYPELEDLSSNDSFVLTNSPSETSSGTSDGAMLMNSSINIFSSDTDDWGYFDN